MVLIVDISEVLCIWNILYSKYFITNLKHQIILKKYILRIPEPYFKYSCHLLEANRLLLHFEYQI
jgi:hypothetical protein